MNAVKKGTPSGAERRRSPRAMLQRAVRVRPADAERPVDVETTRDVSRTGFYFTTKLGHYHIGMRVYAVVGYSPGDPALHESLCEVVRIEKLDAGLWGIGVLIVMR